MGEMGELICSLALGGCLIFAGLFYRHFIQKEFDAIRKINKEGKI